MIANKDVVMGMMYTLASGTLDTLVYDENIQAYVLPKSLTKDLPKIKKGMKDLWETQVEIEYNVDGYKMPSLIAAKIFAAMQGSEFKKTPKVKKQTA